MQRKVGIDREPSCTPGAACWVQNVPDTSGLGGLNWLHCVRVLKWSCVQMYRLCVDDKAVHLIIAIFCLLNLRKKNTEFYSHSYLSKYVPKRAGKWFKHCSTFFGVVFMQWHLQNISYFLCIYWNWAKHWNPQYILKVNLYTNFTKFFNSYLQKYQVFQKYLFRAGVCVFVLVFSKTHNFFLPNWDLNANIFSEDIQSLYSHLKNTGSLFFSSIESWCSS